MKAIYNTNSYKYLLLFLLTAIVLGTNVYSQSGDSTKVTINGLVDIYYSKNFATPSSSSNLYRNFDIAEDQFTISLAKLTVQKAAAPVGFKLDFAYGPTNDLVQSTEPNKSLDFLENAYLSVVVPVGKGLTVNAGKMVTHMGAEVIESSSNLNYSRSFLFTYAIPYYHLGVCASYPVLDNLSVTGYVYNGWNIMQDINKNKTYGASVAWSPTGFLSITGDWIGGIETINSNKSRHVLESVINVAASDALTFNVDADYGFERLMTGVLQIWKGADIIGRYAFNDINAVAIRGEVYNDVTGFTTGTIQTLNEVTLTYEHKFLTDILFRLEYRRDYSNSNVPVFAKGKSEQNTLLVSSVYTF